MSRYNDVINITDVEEFKEYVKSTHNKDVKDIQPYELNALFWKFKLHIGDIDEKDQQFLTEMEKELPDSRKEELAETFYPGKKYADLSAEDKAYIYVSNYDITEQVVGSKGIKAEDIQLNDIQDYISSFYAADTKIPNLVHIVTHTGFENDDIAESLKEKIDSLNNDTKSQKIYEAVHKAYTSRNREGLQQLNDLISDTNDVKVAEDIAKIFGFESNKEWPETTKRIRSASFVLTPTPINEEKEDDKNKTKEEKDRVPPLVLVDDEKDNDKNKKNDEKQKPINEEIRIRSMYSDQNEYLLDNIKISVLHDMKVINDDDIKDLTPQKAIELLQEKVPSLSDKQLAEMESRITDKVVDSEQLLSLVPPSVLAKKYNELSESIKTEKDDKKKQELQGKKEKIATRIDTLTDMLVTEQKTGKDLYFADVTNIADVYDGYIKMFEARKLGLEQEVKDGATTQKDADDKIQKMETGSKILEDKYEQYKDEWNLKGLTADNASDLDKRFDDISKKLETVELDDETAKLVSNFKFYDDKGNKTPQFVDDKGNQSDEYTPGAKVIEGSQLETAIRLAKQRVLMENIGSKDDITPEYLTKEVSESLSLTLYALHVNSNVEKGIFENPKQFTDKKYLDAFVKDLQNPEKEMGISPQAFESGVDAIINQTGAYANALAKEIGNDKPVVTKVLEPIKDLDKRSADRTTNGVNKGKVRWEMGKRTLKGFASAFLVSGAITTLGTMASADAALTVATGGANRIAGMALGTALGVGLSIHQVCKWRKQQKKEGKPAGFKAFFKDRKMVMTVATTALACGALACAATGNPGWAKGLGLAAMAVGTANGVISNYQDATKLGLGKVEAVAWSTLQAVGNIGGALAGRYTAGQLIDMYNAHDPDNKIFQHEEETTKTVTKEVIKEETVYKEGVVERAKETLFKLYGGNEDAMNADLKQVTAQLEGTGVDPHRFLMAAIDSKMNTGVDTLHHVQGGPDMHSHGNHFVLTDAWSQQTGVPQDVVADLGGIKGADGSINITPESIEAFKQIDGFINKYNQVGYVTDAPYQNDGVLGYNASEQGGQFRTDANGDRYTTYANGEGVHEVVKTVDKVTTIVPDTKLVANDKFAGYGMFGIMGNFLNGAKKLKERAGALLDRIVGVRKKKTDDVIPPPPPPAPPVVIKDEDKVQKMLMEEYHIVYGIKPNETDKSFQDYCKRVEAERKSTAPKATMEDFLVTRQATLDKEVLSVIGNTHEVQDGELNKDIKTKANYMRGCNTGNRGSTAIIAKGRESLMQSNLTSENYTGRMTLSHFTKYIHAFINNKGNDIVADGSRDISLNPQSQFKRSREKPNSNVGVTDMNAYLIENKSLSESRVEVKGRDIEKQMDKVRKDNQPRQTPKVKSR